MTDFSHRFRLSGFCGKKRVWAAVWAVLLLELAGPAQALAIQLHQGKEGIIVHQVGHLIFLLSMVVLVFIITGRQLNREYGWKMILLSAVLFSLWHVATITAHFFDNQIQVVTVENLSLWQVKISSTSGSRLMVYFYHGLKLDHLLCVPAIFCFYRGLASLVAAQRQTCQKQNDDREAEA
jgi:hypothetical protein